MNTLCQGQMECALRSKMKAAGIQCGLARDAPKGMQAGVKEKSQRKRPKFNVFQKSVNQGPKDLVSWCRKKTHSGANVKVFKRNRSERETYTKVSRKQKSDNNNIDLPLPIVNNHGGVEEIKKWKARPLCRPLPFRAPTFLQANLVKVHSGVLSIFM